MIVGDVAYTMCRDSLSVTPRAGGEAMELADHRITIYRKQPDGRWLLARDAHTLSPMRAEGADRQLQGPCNAGGDDVSCGRNECTMKSSTSWGPTPIFCARPHTTHRGHAVVAAAGGHVYPGAPRLWRLGHQPSSCAQ